MASDSSRVVRDPLWNSIRLDPTAVGRAEYVFDRAGFPERDRVVVEETGGAELGLEVLGSSNGYEWSEPDESHRFLAVSVRVAPGEAGEVRIRRVAFVPPGAELADRVPARLVVGVPPFRP